MLGALGAPRNPGGPREAAGTRSSRNLRGAAPGPCLCAFEAGARARGRRGQPPARAPVRFQGGGRRSLFAGDAPSRPPRAPRPAPRTGRKRVQGLSTRLAGSGSGLRPKGGGSLARGPAMGSPRRARAPLPPSPRAASGSAPEAAARISPSPRPGRGSPHPHAETFSSSGGSAGLPPSPRAPLRPPADWKRPCRRPAALGRGREDGRSPGTAIPARLQAVGEAEGGRRGAAADGPPPRRLLRGQARRPLFSVRWKEKGLGPASLSALCPHLCCSGPRPHLPGHPPDPDPSPQERAAVGLRLDPGPSERSPGRPAGPRGALRGCCGEQER